MNDAVSTGMAEFWNGEGGKKLLRFQGVMDANLLPFGQVKRCSMLAVGAEMGAATWIVTADKK